jgi:hypothetical protein
MRAAGANGFVRRSTSMTRRILDSQIWGDFTIDDVEDVGSSTTSWR